MRHFDDASQINAAVIGYGEAAGRRLTAMQAAGMTPVAVAEVDADRLAAAQREFPGIETYRTAAELLEKSQANLITVVTPHSTHAELAMACIDAGRHVVCEKPMAVTTAQCDALIAAAQTRGVMLSAFPNRHWDGCILRAVEQVCRRKVIGEVVRVDARICRYGKPTHNWRALRSLSGGILCDWGVHLLDYIFQLVESGVTEVSGFSKAGFWAAGAEWRADANEDEAFVTLRFENGVWATLTISHIDANPKAGFLEVSGTLGSYVMEDWDRYRLIHYGNLERVEEEGLHGKPQFERYFENVAAHLTRGEPLVITPEWARRTVHVLDLAAQSAQKGCALRTEYP